MAYVNVAEWKPEQVTEWLKGLDNAVLPYVHSFLNNEVSGQQLLNLRPDDLDHLGVHKLGHQELILEAVEHLRNFHYELDRENLQLLALRLSCRAHSLHNELSQQTDSRPVSTQTLADVANVITAVKPLVCWLDRSPFSGQLDYQDRKTELLRLSLAIATCAQRDRFAERPVEEIRSSCKELARLADSIIQDIVDPLILQPASLDLATLKKRARDDLGFFILPSFHGVHQIGEIKFSSPAHQCGKIEEGDEVVQVNYQTVVGWQTKKVMALFEESPTDVFLTLKKRPRHTKVYGQIYMKPYRLPSKKRAAPYSRWHDNLPSPRPELLTIPDFEMPLPRAVPKQMVPEPSVLECEPLVSNSSSDDDDDDSFLPGSQEEGQTSPTSMRLYLPKPRVTVQRRATVTGASPTSKRPPVNIEQFWRELRLERQWKDSGPSGEGRKDELYQLRDKSASFGNDLSVSPPPRPTTCLGIEKSCGRQRLKIVENNSSSMESVEQETRSTKTVQFRHEESDSTEENILRVKGGGYGLPSDDLPDAVECVAGESKHKERGRLDKSYSTPAYDLTDCSSSPVSEVEDRQTQRIGEILETINIALLQHCLKQQAEPEPEPPSPPQEVADVWQAPPVPEAPQVKICITPPEPPPRPDCSKTGYRVILAARSLGRNAGSKMSLGGGHATFPSPRSLRKRNPLLAKKRNLSVRDLGAGDCEGWMLHRCRTGGAGAVWLRAWFVLKGSLFYGFKTPQSSKADIMICLPGFTASLADEVKSRKFAFKVYHTGTVFYFAVESEEELAVWMDCMTLATFKQGHESDAVFFSETDEESETDMETETCFPSPKMRKFAGFLSSSSQQSSRSQQNLATETKSQDSQKKFGSLRKLGRKGNESMNPEMSGAASSLDRKYLRFLGGSRNNIVPVPTAQFRSYRRVPNGPAPAPIKAMSDICTEKIEQPHKANEGEVSEPAADRDGRQTRLLLSPHDRLLPHAMHRRDRPIHSSNPSLQLPSDMADYRMAAERLREFGISRNRQREDTSGFVTLEEFMLSRQEEERRQNSRTGSAEAYTGSTEDSTSITDTSGCSRNNSWSSNRLRNGGAAHTRTCIQESQGREYSGGSAEKMWINSLRQNDKVPTNCLKTAAQYQPPPASHPGDEAPRMRLAFEMHLGNKDAKSSKLRSLFSSSRPQQQKQSFLEPPAQKTLLGSPRLHRAIFKDKKHKSSSASDSSSGSLSSPAACEELDPSMACFKPTMGISMIGKKPSRRILNSSPSPASPPPDYPGLEYPPVFEPETYTLSDASTLLRSRKSKSRRN
ncbi:connector enhancer of kinase suppressor of ras 2 isoform X2 [Periplaneta americana]|uniref:connector enhancer of kinase suppressor of ras 2 isoform X2 n=1 Tax=Periplaneta americana TaxID=6978 RepID=UPI0037E9BBBC